LNDKNEKLARLQAEIKAGGEKAIQKQHEFRQADSTGKLTCSSIKAPLKKPDMFVQHHS